MNYPPPSQPICLVVKNVSLHAQYAYLFDPFYSCRGIVIESQYDLPNYQEICRDLENGYTIKLLRVAADKINYTEKPTLEHFINMGKFITESLNAQVISFDAVGNQVTIPLPFKILEEQNQKNISDLEMEFRLAKSVYIGCQLMPGMRYSFMLYKANQQSVASIGGRNLTDPASIRNKQS